MVGTDKICIEITVYLSLFISLSKLAVLLNTACSSCR